MAAIYKSSLQNLSPLPTSLKKLSPYLSPYLRLVLISL